MIRRHCHDILGLCAAAFGALLWAGCGDESSKEATRERPNVVLIIADDLGWKDVGFHGGEIDTPNIDKLAAEGVELTSFRTAPACTPTRAAFLTGRSPLHFGLWYSVLGEASPYGLPEAEYTLAERFRDAGYATSLVGKWHLGHARPEYHPNAQGFDDFFGCMICSRSYWSHRAMDGSAHDLQHNGQPVERPEFYMTDLLTKRALRRIEERDRDRPFFLVVAYQAPHSPIHPSLAQSDKYTTRGFSESRARYAGVVDRLDYGIGKILRALDREALAENTIVVLVSDNGGSMTYGADNGPWRGEKLQTFEGGVRVPALLRFPGVLPPGHVSDQLARDRDLFATLEHAAGLPRRAPAESLDLWPQLQGAPSENDRDFFFVFRGKPDVGFWRGVLQGNRWKLVLDTRSGVETTHLFDLATDPGEQRNLADERPEIASELSRLFDEQAARHPPGGLREYPRTPEGWSTPDDLSEIMRASSEPLGAQEGGESAL